MVQEELFLMEEAALQPHEGGDEYDRKRDENDGCQSFVFAQPGPGIHSDSLALPLCNPKITGVIRFSKSRAHLWRLLPKSLINNN